MQSRAPLLCLVRKKFNWVDSRKTNSYKSQNFARNIINSMGFASNKTSDSLQIWFVSQRNPESQLFPPQSDLGTQCAANNEDIYRKESQVLVSFLPSKSMSWNRNYPLSFLSFRIIITEYTSLTRLPQHMYIISTGFTHGQKFEKVENGENRFFAITSSKLVRNWFCKKHLVRNHIFHNFCLNYGL